MSGEVDLSGETPIPASHAPVARRSWPPSSATRWVALAAGIAAVLAGLGKGVDWMIGARVDPLREDVQELRTDVREVLRELRQR